MKSTLALRQFATIVGMLAMSVQFATAGTATLTPTIDLHSDQLTLFDEAFLDIGYDGFDPNVQGQPGSDNRAVVLFDLSSVPGPITQATFTINQIDPASGNQQFGFAGLRSIGTPWTGASSAQEIFDVVLDANSNGLIAFSGDFTATPNVNGDHVLSTNDITALAEGWRNGAVTNYGFGLHGAEGFTLTARRFNSSETGAVLGPRLTVEFIPEPASSFLAMMAAALVMVSRRRYVN